MNKKQKPFFSVVIPTLNEEKYLPLLLADLSKQSYQNFEVIVADAHSTDLTVKKATQFQNKIKLTVILSKEKNVSAQRNLGGKKAAGKWIVFMDADNRLPLYFLRGIKYRLEKEKKTDFFSTCSNTDNYKNHEKILTEFINLYLILSSTNNPIAAGAMIGVKKNIFKKHQFDEKLKNQEDYYFIKSLHQNGYNFKMLIDPTYEISLRRLHKEGLLKMAYTFLHTNTAYLRGKKFTEIPKCYPMEGGSYYEEETN